MSELDAILRRAEAEPERVVFVSRSGADERQRELAIWVRATLERSGYTAILQDAHFKHTDFMLAMDRTLATGVRVLALMSRDYLKSNYCMKEATTALDDPGNSSGRLIILNIDDCRPLGMLRYLDRINFAGAWRANDARVMEEILLKALEDPGSVDANHRLPAALDATQIVHPQVLMHDENAFTGREDDLQRLSQALWSGGTATVTCMDAAGVVDEAALAGMGGVGKTTLARAYAFLNRERYHAVWWVRADNDQVLIDDLIELGARFDPRA